MLTENAKNQLRDLVAAHLDETDDEILGRCAADPRTDREIDGGVLRAYLGQKGRMARIADTAAAKAATDPAVSLGLRSFLLFLPGGKSFDTHTPSIAAEADLALAAVVADYADSGGLRGLSAAEVADIVAMGGGYSLKGATADDVAEARRWVGTQALAVDLYGRVKAFFNGIGNGPVPTLADFKATLP